MALGRNAAPNLRSGRARTDFTKIAGVKMDYAVGALSVTMNTAASVTSNTGKPREEITDMRSPIGSLMVSRKSFVVGAKSGKPRVSSIRNANTKTDWRCGARSVQIELLKSLIGSGAWQCEINQYGRSKTRRRRVPKFRLGIKPLYASPEEFGETLTDEFGVMWTTHRNTFVPVPWGA